MRGDRIGRALKLAIKMAQCGVRVRDLEGYEYCNGKIAKMFYRDIHLLEEAGIPVYKDDEHRWRIDAHFMRRFL